MHYLHLLWLAFGVLFVISWKCSHSPRPFKLMCHPVPQKSLFCIMELLIQTITHMNAQNLFLLKQLKWLLFFFLNVVLAETGNFFTRSHGVPVDKMCMRCMYVYVCIWWPRISVPNSPSFINQMSLKRAHSMDPSWLWLCLRWQYSSLIDTTICSLHTVLHRLLLVNLVIGDNSIKWCVSLQ